jgi:predicted nucleotidyltransferase
MPEEIIEEIKNILRENFKRRKLKLNKLVLFGSYAKNNYSKESDLDLIIVSSDFRNKTLSKRVKIMLGLNYELVKNLKMPVDTFYYSDREWNKGESLIINEAKMNGIVLLG